MNTAPLWVLFGILSLISEVAFVLNSKKFMNAKMKNFDPVALATIFYSFVCVLAFSYSIFFAGEDVLGSYLNLINGGYGIYILLNIILYTGAPYLYWHALKNISASDTSIIYSFLGVHTLWIGLLFFGKTIGLFAVIGIVVLFASQIIVNWKGQGIKFGRYQIYMIIGTLLYAAAFLTDSIILGSNQISVTGHMVGRFLFPAIFLFLFWPWRIRNAIEISSFKGSKFFLLTNTFLMFGSYFFAYFAYELGASAPAIAAILGLESVLIVFLENTFIGKIDHFMRKIAAAFLAVGGIILLSI